MTQASMHQWRQLRDAYAPTDLHASLPPHSSHPALPRLTLLVFEAVLEVVCVSLPGYIIARQGMFSADMQKFAANLNVILFTPCLIFTKLASQLSADKLADLAIIPIIFIVQTLISYLSSLAMAKLFGLSKRPRNFVIAMGVFGNSNSLPISLVLSLSQTIKGLHWDRIPNDNDDEVAARGILYLLIFQQLGQLVRWSWGYNVLLAPAHTVSKDPPSTPEQAVIEHRISDPDEQTPLLQNVISADHDLECDGDAATKVDNHQSDGYKSRVPRIRDLEAGNGCSSGYSNLSTSSATRTSLDPSQMESSAELPHSQGSNHSAGERHAIRDGDQDVPESSSFAFVGHLKCAVSVGLKTIHRISAHASSSAQTLYLQMPHVIRKFLESAVRVAQRFARGLWEFMNPPLWAMLAAIIVASIPALQHFFFAEGTFFKNSVTSAISQSGGVAVPLILVVLGGNLARNTGNDELHSKESQKEELHILIASLISRMLLPLIIMAPILALTAKYVPISILADPIFVIVCFLITGAPSALQLAQICQINNVYMGAMSKLLFQSYVIWILPSTLVLVLCALEVVEWAQA